MRGAAPKRRYEWLRGRCAAKDAVRRLVSAGIGRQLRAADVQILPDAWGKPCVRGHWIADSGIQPAVSLAHSGGVAVALAHAHGNALVGIDVESRAPDRDGFERLAFDAGEQKIIAGLAADGRKEWLLRLWCAKEAAVKALGRGFEQGLHSVAVVGVDLATGAVSLRVQNGLLQQFPGLAGRVITAQTVCTPDLVLSTILSKKDLSQ
jgi:phosphopantetheinyl transferase